MASIIKPRLPHPLDPLSADEIAIAIAAVRKHHGECFFNVVSLHEPRKAEMLKWLESVHSPASESLRPARVANVVVIIQGGKIYDGLIDIKSGSIMKLEPMEGVQPIVSVSPY